MRAFTFVLFMLLALGLVAADETTTVTSSYIALVSVTEYVFTASGTLTTVTRTGSTELIPVSATTTASSATSTSSSDSAATSTASAAASAVASSGATATTTFALPTGSYYLTSVSRTTGVVNGTSLVNEYILLYTNVC